MTSLKKFRDKAIAHSDLRLEKPRVPNMEMALNALTYLYKELQANLLSIKEYLVVDKGLTCIDMWTNNLKREAENYIQRAVCSTASIKKITEHSMTWQQLGAVIILIILSR